MIYGSDIRPLLADVGLNKQRCRCLDGCVAFP